jgi:hypothetical protein
MHRGLAVKSQVDRQRGRPRQALDVGQRSEKHLISMWRYVMARKLILFERPSVTS